MTLSLKLITPTLVSGRSCAWKRATGQGYTSVLVRVEHGGKARCWLALYAFPRRTSLLMAISMENCINLSLEMCFFGAPLLAAVTCSDVRLVERT